MRRSPLCLCTASERHVPIVTALWQARVRAARPGVDKGRSARMRWTRSVATIAAVLSIIGVCASTAQCADCGCGYAGCPGPNQCNRATCIEEACWCLGGPCGHCRTHCSWVDGCINCNYPDSCRIIVVCNWSPDSGCDGTPGAGLCTDGCCPTCPPTKVCACFAPETYYSYLCHCSVGLCNCH